MTLTEMCGLLVVVIGFATLILKVVEISRGK